MVGATGFEPATTCPPDKCATVLRYAPTGANRSTTLSSERPVYKGVPLSRAACRLGDVLPALIVGRAVRGDENIAQLFEFLPASFQVEADWGRSRTCPMLAST